MIPCLNKKKMKVSSQMGLVDIFFQTEQKNVDHIEKIKEFDVDVFSK